MVLAVYGMLVFIFEKAISVISSQPLFILERLFDIPLIILLYILSCVSELCGIRGRLFVFLPMWFLTGIIIIYCSNKLHGFLTAGFLVVVFIINALLIYKYRKKEKFHFLPSQKKKNDNQTPSGNPVPPSS